MHWLRGSCEGYWIVIFFGLRGQDPSSAAGAGPGGASGPSARAAAIGGHLAGGTATLQEIPVHCDLASASAGARVWPLDSYENWSGEDLDNDHLDPGE